MSEQGHLRIGTDDRRNAVARLQSAAAEGRLTPAEASGRMAAVEAALTYADLREAVCLAPVIDIDVSAGAGSVKIIVPPGWGVDSDQVTKGRGSARNTADRGAEPGQPQLVLHGSAGVGRLRVRTAPARRRRRAQRELAGAPTPASGWTEQHSEMPNADDLR